MTKLQIGTIISAITLFAVLYFGCDIKPKSHQQIEQQRALNQEVTNISVLLGEAMPGLDEKKKATILGLETSLRDIESDSQKVNVLKVLAGKWFEYGHPEISGHYAQTIAEKLETDYTAWSIAGTTYTLCVQRSQSEKVREFCTQNGIKAFESAVSIKPEDVSTRVNMALLHVENPPKDNPMKGILMLRELNNQYPENTSVLTNLGRLAIMTNQWEKAKERLESVMKIDPLHTEATCLLVDVYQQMNNTEKAADAQARCRALQNG